MKYRPAGQAKAEILGRNLLVSIVSLFVVLSTVVGVDSAFADTTYLVQPGDTISGIAARYGTTVDAIVTANNLPNRSTIYTGQTLTIPTGNPEPPSGNANQPS